jgi:carbonic anhydrase
MPGIRADIEFAVKELNVERIIVLGHSGCGGIGALMEGEGDKFEFIGAWVSIAAAARERVLREMAGKPRAAQVRACEQGAIALSLENLQTFPWIQERVEAGALTLDGWYFDMDAGELLGYSAETERFAALVARVGDGGISAG